VAFTLGSQSASGWTDGSGLAETNRVLDQAAGSYLIKSDFAGDGLYADSHDSDTFMISIEDATPEYSGDTIVPTTAKTIELRATIYEAQDDYFGDLTKISVTFSINGVVVGSAPVIQGPSGYGVATLTIPNRAEGDYEVVVEINPNNFYTTRPTSDIAIVEVYTPTGSFVTGGGWITDTTGSKGSFGFTVKTLQNGKAQGHMTYVWRQNGLCYVVKSTAVTGFRIADGRYGYHAYFEGKAVVRTYDPMTGETIWNDGNYKFRTDVWDYGEPGIYDVFQITVRDKIGIVWHQAGYDPYGCLNGGNIAAHLEKTKASSVAPAPMNPEWLAVIVCLTALALLALRSIVAQATRHEGIGKLFSLAGPRRAASSARQTRGFRA
jgi:hypothetical protein